MAQKFKVGDKVKLINMDGAVASGAKLGSELTITELLPEERYKVGYISVNSGRYVPNGKVFARNIELLPIKLKKNERISALEAQVAELTAKVEALEKQPKPTDIAEMFAQALLNAQKETTPNAQRKAIISEAKAFVAKQFVEGNYGVGKVVWGDSGHNKVEFVVNAENRTVVAILRIAYVGTIVTAKAIAKCAPDAVFNADIGKAIALGRALGLDVKRFEQAVKPTIAIGQLLEHKDRNRSTYRVNSLQGDLTITDIGGNNASAYGGNLVEDMDWYDITDDTDAQY